MPAPTYTEDEAAVHELGHAALACALDIPFDRIDLSVVDPTRGGWRGQCFLSSDARSMDAIMLDAFQIGGPLTQLAIVPDSIDAARMVSFEPSLFSNPA